MRNLKRALSLGLTAAMISGLMVMGSSAASYADVTSEDNQEAIEVLEAVGIMIGDENGDFNPDQNVTRNEMAVVMANLMEYNVASYRDTSPFTDVPSWAEPYVAACWTNGITAGYSDTIYGGSDTVTTAQAALMLMKALGYFQYASDFGSDWQLATTRQGNAIDLFDGVDSGVTAPMTRNDVAQLVLNTLEAGTVTASTDGSWSIGDVTIVNNVTYNYVTSNSSYAESIHSVKSTSSTSDADRYVVELGEQLYQGDLRLREGTTDDFGRPSRTWSYENSEIGTYADTPDLTYTAKVESGDVYKDLGLGSNINKSDVTVFVDGLEDEDLALSIRKGSDDKVGQSANGVLTEVYYDEDADTVLVIQVNTYVGTVVRSVEASGNRDAYVVIAPEAPIGTGLTAPISGNEQFETDEDFEDEAYVLYTYSESADEIKSVQLAELVNGTVTRAENDNKNEDDAKALTIDGTRYTDSYMVAGEKLGDISVDEEYNVYLDSYGYMIYVERIDEIGDYALLYTTNGGTVFNSHKAFLVFADGTTGVVDTDKNYYSGDYAIPDKTIVTYRVDDNNEYTLRAVSSKQSNGTTNATVRVTDDVDFNLVNDKAGITNVGEPSGVTVTANSATTFVVRDPASRTYDEVYDWTAYTGIKNAPSIEVKDLDNPTNDVQPDEMVNVYYYCKNGSMVTIMFIVPDKEVVIEDGVNRNIYLSSRDISNLIHDTNYSDSYFEFQAVVDGEPTTVKVASDANGLTTEAAVKALGGHLYDRYTTNKDGIITSLTLGDAYTGVNDESGIIDGAVGIDKVSREYTVILNTALTDWDGDGTKDPKYTITCDEDAQYFYVDEDGDVNVSSYNGIAIDEDDLVYAVVDDYMVQTLVIYEVDTTNNAQPATVTVTGGKTVTEGEELVLTAKVTLDDSRHDEVIGYQWYYTTAPAYYAPATDDVDDVESNATRIAGATGQTLTVDTSTDFTTRYYYCVVETYNDRVTGTDTAKGFGVSNATTVNNPAPETMDVLVTFMNGTTELYQYVYNVTNASNSSYVNVDGNAVLTAAALEETSLAGYKVTGQSVKPVQFNTAGGDVTFQLTAKSNTTVLTVTQEGGGTVTNNQQNIQIAANASMTFGYSLTDSGTLTDVRVESYNGSDTDKVTVTETASNFTIALDSTATSTEWYQIFVSFEAEDGTAMTDLMFWIQVQ